MVASGLLALCLAGLSGDSVDPARLVDRLGSSRFAEREAAARALEELGAQAVPALQEGRKSADLEVRARSATLLRKAEGALLTQATLVWLNFHDTPITDVIRQLRERTGMSLSLVPERLPRWSQARVDLQEAGPVPFWQAVDRLCAAAGLHADLEMLGSTPRSGATLGLTPQSYQPVYPAFDHGPFRVRLTDLEFHRKIHFAIEPIRPPGPRNDQAGEVGRTPRTRPVASVQCVARIQVMAEPRLSVSQQGPVHLVEAADDLGHSLLPPAPAPLRLARVSSGLGASCSSTLSLELALSRPEAPGKTIRSLRGTIPLRVAARQPDPLVIRLDGAAGKSFDCEDLHVSIHDVRSDARLRQRQIELTVRVDRPDAPGAGDELGEGDLAARVDPLAHQIEVLDDRGRALPWFQTGVDVETSRLTLTVAGLAGGEPREVRCYRLSEATVNLPFAFHDVPLP